MSNLPTWLDMKYCIDRFRPLKNRKWIPRQMIDSWQTFTRGSCVRKA